MPLPTFIIGGARRGGTTSTYYWLSEHPEIYLPPKADMDFFIDKQLFNRQWYDGEEDAQKWEREFSLETYSQVFEEGQGYGAIGQKDADLLSWKPAHPRLARYLPETKFIFTLRNPVERAWSHYWNERGKERETLSFEDALEAEDERSRRSAYARLHLAYRASGLYDEAFQSFFAHIPPERVKIITVENSRENPRETLRGLFEFLGVNPDAELPTGGKRYNSNTTMLLRPWADTPVFRPIERVYNRITNGVIVRMTADKENRKKARQAAERLFRFAASEIKMREDTRKRLNEIYKPHVDNLEQLLNRRFPEWNLS